MIVLISRLSGRRIIRIGPCVDVIVPDRIIFLDPQILRIRLGPYWEVGHRIFGGVGFAESEAE